MDAKISKLFDDLVEDRLTAEQGAELSRLLAADPAAAEAFSDLLRVHFGLAERTAPVRAFSLVELRAMKAVDDRFDRHLSAQAGRPAARRDSHAARRWKTAFAVAAAALVGLSMWSLWDRQGRQTTAESSGGAAG